jgi:hypothetical protein
MDEANRADMRAERLMVDAARAIQAVLENGHRVHTALDDTLTDALHDLREEAAHIVAVWD